MSELRLPAGDGLDASVTEGPDGVLLTQHPRTGDPPERIYLTWDEADRLRGWLERVIPR